MGKIYGGFRSEPVKKGAPKGNMKKHCTATKEYAEDQRSRQVAAYGYSYVEPENVKYNRVLVDCPETYEEKIRECNQEKFGGRTIRRDGIPMIDTVFYYSPEKTKNLLCYFHKNNEHWKKEHADWWDAYKSMPKEERQKKINEEYNWVQSWAKESEKWAEKNLGQVVHCVLHCHEGTPHLDCKTLAIKEKEGGKWIWAKREILGNPAHLSKMQTKYAEECGKKFGLERGEIKETGELRKHAETERHMAAKAREQEEAHLDRLQNEVLDVQGAIFDKQADLQELEQKVAAAEQQAAEQRAEIKEAGDRLLSEIDGMVRAHDGLRRALNVSRLSDKARGKIEVAKDKTDTRTEKALEQPLDDVDAILAAASAAERAKRTYTALKSAAKGNLDIDDLLDDYER